MRNFLPTSTKSLVFVCCNAFTVLLVVGMLRGKTGVEQYFALKQARQELQVHVNDLKSENIRLRDEITRIKKSKSYARKVLRDKYHVTAPDESIIFFGD